MPLHIVNPIPYYSIHFYVPSFGVFNELLLFDFWLPENSHPSAAPPMRTPAPTPIMAADFCVSVHGAEFPQPSLFDNIWVRRKGERAGK